MLIYLIAVAGIAILLAGLYLARCAWTERHPREVWNREDGPDTYLDDHDDFLGIGS